LIWSKEDEFSRLVFFWVNVEPNEGDAGRAKNPHTEEALAA
jgi:hypothetical protein